MAVSYTHLFHSTYDRFCESRAFPRSGKPVIMVLGSGPIRIGQGIESVSYTHLDVYKRQSQRGEESRTLVLARTFLDAWQARHPEAEVETVEPEALLALKPFAPEMLNDRDALAGIRCFDAPVYDLARQFRAADRVVVAAPFWDLTFPAALRTYIEYISANGLTYHYEADGCHGD